MTLALRVSDQAKVDLLEIWCFIAEDNPQAADQMVDRLIGVYPLLLSMPGIGRLREDLRPALRSRPVNQYLIFYRTTETHIEILRVIHGSRHLETLFGNETIETFRIEDI